MSFIKRIMSAVLSVSIGLLSISAAPCSAVETDYIYNSILSEKSKDSVSEMEKPFNVFDIYNAYYGIVPTTTVPVSTSALSTVTTTSVSTEITTTATNTTKTTALTTIPTTTKKTTAVATQAPKTTLTSEIKTTKITTIPTTTVKTTAVSTQSPKTTPPTEIKTTAAIVPTTTVKTTAAATQPPKTTPPTEIKTTAAIVPTTTVKTTAAATQPPKTTLTSEIKTTKITTIPTTTVKTTAAATQPPKTTPTTEPKTTTLTPIPTTTELTTIEEPITTVISTTQETTEFTTQESTTSEVTTTAESTAPVTTTTILLKGIDVSKYQLDIDWETAKASGEVDFAIIQAGYGKSASNADYNFGKNVQGAQAAGVDVGVYWFSYATSVEDAKQEAQACLEVIKGYSFTYPVYYDFEYQWALRNLSYATLSAMVDTFCSTLEENGYYVGVYSSASDLEYCIYRHVLSKYDVWVAEYGNSVSWYHGDYGMWQYTGSGSVPGVSTIVDKNYCYKDFPSIIGVNPKGGQIPVYTPTVQRGGIVENTSEPYNWAEFDKESYKYAMLEVDSVQNLDAVKANIDAAHAEGIDCGILYLAEDADSDTVSQNAEALYNMLSTVKLEYPVYYWFNKPDLSDYSVGTTQLSENAEAFCSYLEQFRYFVGIAAYDVPLAEQLDNALYKKYTVWRFNEQGTPVVYSGNCGMVSDWDNDIGVYAHYRQMKFPEIIAKNGLNGYPKE